MATYSSNTTIKVGSNINQRGFNGSDFSYTVPANSYLVLSQYYIGSAGAGSLTINYPSPSGSESYSSSGTFGLTPHRSFGSGTVFSSTTGAFGEVEISGYLMVNTP